MTAGRPLQFDPEHALYSALQLFWQHGYESTSLHNLLARMGLSKSSFYQAFGNKHQLYERCLERYRTDMLVTLRDALSDCDSGWELIRALFTNTISQTEGREYHWGCLAMNAASEFAQRDRTVSREITATTTSFMAIFSEIIQLAQQQGDIPQDKNPELLARYLLSSLSGLHSMLKAGTSQQDAEEMLDVILHALK